jgi:hypothetical protein
MTMKANMRKEWYFFDFVFGVAWDGELEELEGIWILGLILMEV